MNLHSTCPPLHTNTPPSEDKVVGQIKTAAVKEPDFSKPVLNKKAQLYLVLGFSCPINCIGSPQYRLLLNW